MTDRKTIVIEQVVNSSTPIESHPKVAEKLAEGYRLKGKTALGGSSPGHQRYEIVFERRQSK